MVYYYIYQWVSFVKTSSVYSEGGVLSIENLGILEFRDHLTIW